ncbi:MAG: hypothetical protein JNM14_09865 [Ferruginibacter sp.]|nr:hypothetical protein [Ferruginibacter sp.]
MWNQSEKTESLTIFNNLEHLQEGKKGYNNLVDELLLSANEFNIYGKSSFIEYNYRDDNSTNELLIGQIKTNPEKAYQTILKNKIKRLKQQQPVSPDFNVKPVPK